MTDDNLLRIYVNDHLAALVGGIRLARRSRSKNRDSLLGAYLSELVSELKAERAVILRIFRAFDARRSPVKMGLARLGELVGRLKLNGRLSGYSDLSRVLEVEWLCLEATYRQLMWASLRRMAEEDARLHGFDFAGLEDRARTQHTRLSAFRVDASATALSRRPWPPPA
jgi:hypothetical protein